MNASAIGYWPNHFKKASYFSGRFSAKKSHIEPSLGFLGAVVWFLIILMSAGYFLEINSASSLGYDIKAYQKSVSNLKIENQRLKIIIGESAALKKMEDPAQMEKLNLVKVSEYQHLTIMPSGFAKR
jgi:hypothetical protein